MNEDPGSNYMRTLIWRDQHRIGRERLDHQLIEAIERGEAVEMTAEDWKHIRDAVRARLAAKRMAK